MTWVLHLAPFDASRYPPLIQTVHACREAGLESVVEASVPLRAPGVFEGLAEVNAPHALWRGPRQVLHLRQRGRLACRRRRPDLVVAHNVRGLVAAAALGPGHRLVYHCHDFEDPPGRTTLFRVLERLAVRRAAEIWLPAHERAQIAKNRGLNRPLQVVRNCPRRTPSLPTPGTLRAWIVSQGGAGEAPLVVGHGSIGAAHCIRETVDLLPDLPTAQLVVIGDGDREYIQACRDQAARLGVGNRLWFHPFVPHDQLNALLVDADVAMNLYAPVSTNAVFPAPNKVYESMAAGIPVLVTAGNSVSDDVVQAGAGLAVRLGDRRAFLEALGSLLRDSQLATRMGDAGRRAHLERYCYEVQLEPTILGRQLAGGLSRWEPED